MPSPSVGSRKYPSETTVSRASPTEKLKCDGLPACGAPSSARAAAGRAKAGAAAAIFSRSRRVGLSKVMWILPWFDPRILATRRNATRFMNMTDGTATRRRCPDGAPCGPRSAHLLQPRHIARQRVDLEVDRIAHRRLSPCGRLLCMRDEIDPERAALHLVHGQRCAIQRNRPLGRYEFRQRLRSAQGDAGAVALIPDRHDLDRKS